MLVFAIVSGFDAPTGSEEDSKMEETSSDKMSSVPLGPFRPEDMALPGSSDSEGTPGHNLHHARGASGCRIKQQPFKRQAAPQREWHSQQAQISQETSACC